MTETIAVWQSNDGSLLHTMQTGRGGSLGLLMYSPNGDYLLSGGLVPDMALWDTDTGEGYAWLQGLGGERVSAAFSPDGSLLLTSALDGPVSLWNMHTGTRTNLETGVDRVLFVDWSDDGRIILLIDALGPAYVWGLADVSSTE